MNKLLEEVTQRMSQNKVYENHYSQLQTIVDKVVRHTKDFEALLTLVRLTDLFQNSLHGNIIYV